MDSQKNTQVLMNQATNHISWSLEAENHVSRDYYIQVSIAFSLAAIAELLNKLLNKEE